MTGALVSGASVFEGKLGRLPGVVRAKFIQLESRADDLADATRSATTAWEETHRRLGEARAVHAAAAAAEARDPEVTAKRRHGSYQPGPQLTATTSALAMAEEKATSRLADRDRAQALSTAALTVARNLTQLITETDPTELAPVLVKRPDGTDLSADVQRLREQITGVVREAAVLERAPIPLTEALADQQAFLDRVAAEYDPIVTPFALPHLSLPPSPADLVPYRLAPLLASLPEWRAVLQEKLQATYATLPAAVASDERAPLFAALRERKVKLEMAEESVILQAEAQGVPLARRADASPDVVLRVILKD
jgi:hypothetical protein